MLAKRRSLGNGTRRRVAHLVGKPKLLTLRTLRTCGLPNHFAGAGLRVLESLGHREHGFAATVRITHILDPLVSCPRLEDCPHFLKEFLSQLPSIKLARDEIIAANLPAEVRPELRLQRSKRHEFSVARFVDTIKRICARERILSADFDCRSRKVMGSGNRQHREHYVEHRYVDVLTAAGSLASQQRGEHRKCRDHPAGKVGYLHSRNHRLAALIGSQTEYPRQREIVQVVTAALAMRTILPEPGQRTVDDLRVYRGNGGIVDT